MCTQRAEERVPSIFMTRRVRVQEKLGLRPALRVTNESSRRDIAAISLTLPSLSMSTHRRNRYIPWQLKASSNPKVLCSKECEAPVEVMQHTLTSQQGKLCRLSYPVAFLAQLQSREPCAAGGAFRAGCGRSGPASNADSPLAESVGVMAR